ncbi:MAG TPA: hypothetical protein VGP69_01165 [Gaiellaceae bacterium]|nr:hypothetical protein [Gaiellaceae bacterium]
MSLLWAGLVIAAVMAFAITAMLFASGASLIAHAERLKGDDDPSGELRSVHGSRDHRPPT